MSDLVNELADSLESEGQKTVAFFNAVQPEQWLTQVYKDGPGWKVHDLLAHFTEVEGSISRMIARIVAGGEGVADGFSIDEHNARFTAEMSAQDNATLLAEFASRRAATVAMVRAMNEDDLEKRGRHPFLGPSAVKEMLRLMYIHLQGHQRDIRRALKKA